MGNYIMELEKAYCQKYLSVSDELVKLFECIMKENEIDLSANSISKAMLHRLVAYYEFQSRIKSLLGKRYTAPGADYFVETVLFYLKLVLAKHMPHYEVESERSIERKRGSIRPDISIWKNEELIAIIECKTQLGWNRNNWESDFEGRVALLKESYPNAEAYLLVMSATNWQGFGENKNIGKRYFVLSKHWPGEINSVTNEVIENRIEGLFQRIIFPDAQ